MRPRATRHHTPEAAEAEAEPGPDPQEELPAHTGPPPPPGCLWASSLRASGPSRDSCLVRRPRATGTNMESKPAGGFRGRKGKCHTER